MKKVPLLAAALLAAAATFAQTSSGLLTFASPATLAHQPGTQGRSHTPSSAAAEPEKQHIYAQEIALARQKERKAEREAFREEAKEKKEHGKQVRKEQKEALTEMEASATALTETPENVLPQDQERPRKSKKDKSSRTEQEPSKEKGDNHGKAVNTVSREVAETGADKGQEVKEVASARRQRKPEKVDASGEVPVEAAAKVPRSAARPGRGAARGAVQGANTTVTKTTGGAVKAVKAAKPLKVGVGVKAGKN
ncbi:hypothetical protein [Rufibacter ruber]|uniref:hypothetical protein n=1 Tax=Rufibacter ruber TaxID=1783499 RepID=UPI0008310088|nr:hypothetical protein [Rufibacter ruber]